MKTRSKTFLPVSAHAWEDCGEGIRRRIVAYDPHLMTVEVAFDTGSVGAQHAHYHSQATYIVSGRFEVRIEGQTQRLGPGDGYYVAPDTPHGLRCLEQGTVLDVFSPVRADFPK